jgi:hypothetical protein
VDKDYDHADRSQSDDAVRILARPFSPVRRLRPLILTHWLMDFAGVALTLKF